MPRYSRQCIHHEIERLIREGRSVQAEAEREIVCVYDQFEQARGRAVLYRQSSSEEDHPIGRVDGWLPAADARSQGTVVRPDHNCPAAIPSRSCVHYPIRREWGPGAVGPRGRIGSAQTPVGEDRRLCAGCLGLPPLG